MNIEKAFVENLPSEWVSENYETIRFGIQNKEYASGWEVYEHIVKNLKKVVDTENVDQKVKAIVLVSAEEIFNKTAEEVFCEISTIIDKSIKKNMVNVLKEVEDVLKNYGLQRR